MKVDFLDLNAQYQTIKPEIHCAIHSVLESSAFVGGPFVRTFEDNFANAHHAAYCVGTSCGTSALHIAMWALGIQTGDEVIVPANTFVATAEAVNLCGATPVFVDCSEKDFNIDPGVIEKAITSKTRAVVAVHLYGQPAPLDRLAAIAKKHGIYLIEDCAQAHLASYKGKPVGTWGICGCFSFYPGKNLGAYGESGAVITNDETLYSNMQMLREHGSKQKYYHNMVGHNYRMHGIQGAILNVKLAYLEDWTDARRKNAALYRKYLNDCKQIKLPHENADSKHVYHLFVIRTPQRDALSAFLKENDIATGIHYPIPCHLQKCYQYLNYKPGSIPTAEQCAREVLSLPMYPELTEEQIRFVATKTKEFFLLH